MRRGLRLLAMVLSLLVAGGCIWLWVKTYKSNPPEQWSWLIRGRRYTLRAQQGRLYFRAPPRDSDAILYSVKFMSNDDVGWIVIMRKQGDRYVGVDHEIRDSSGRLRRITQEQPDVIPRLLAALEDEKRFAVAHVLLQLKTRSVFARQTSQKADHVLAVFGGLEVKLRPWRQKYVFESSAREAEEICKPEEVSIDPAQMPRIRQLWHDQLDVARGSAPFAVLVGAFSAAPLWWGVAMVRRLCRRRPGLCRGCGYDLRETPLRCPECGLQVVKI